MYVNSNWIVYIIVITIWHCKISPAIFHYNLTCVKQFSTFATYDSLIMVRDVCIRVRLHVFQLKTCPDGACGEQKVNPYMTTGKFESFENT